ncbi:tRNA-specific adenosine deaminase [Acrocarpospora corrugata]|uniref:tRNA-specific adenosine deaminase n=1 Tax=Acrocarpospora corrugata TaxID=35763 RepID=A0A5M3WEM7_9ACTN|nr:tRNA-specific adenosine deaminase [Acrocarpospora corrugata]
MQSASSKSWSFDETELAHLRRCVALAAEAIDAGDEPFGSVLVSADGTALAEDRNRDNTGADQTLHPEFQLARWAAAHLTLAERAAATVFTSGEHCPMCSAAHAWVGLGRIVYVASSTQLVTWLSELGLGPAPVNPLPIQQIAPGIRVEGPIPQLTEEIHALHLLYRSKL